MNLYRILEVTEEDVGHAIGLLKNLEGTVQEAAWEDDLRVVFFCAESIFSIKKERLSLEFTQ